MSSWMGSGLLVMVVGFAGAIPVRAETPVQPSWRCDVAGQVVLSNTPCRSAAQSMRAGSSVIYRCEQNGVISFQQGACKEAKSPVYLHNDNRTKASIASAEQVRKQAVSSANKSRQQQLSREKSSKVTVIGVQKTGTYTAGDGNSDGYSDARSETASHSGY